MTKIYYRAIKGEHVFYIDTSRNTYYLFTQPKRRGVAKFYRGGVILDRAINHGIGRRDYAIHKTMNKLVQQIEYIEKENNIIILKKTKKKVA